MVLASPTAEPRVRASTPPTSSLRRGSRSAATALSRSWLRLGLFAAGLLAAFGSLNVVLEDVGWWVASAAMVVIPLLAIGLARQFGRRAWQPVVVALVVSIALLTFAYAPLDSLLGVVPTGDTFARWVALAVEGGNSIASQRMPAVATEGIQFLLAILALASVLFVAPALDRAPAIAALPILVVLDIPVAIRAGVAQPLWFVLAVLAYLALLRLGRRRMPAGGVIATAALVVIGSLALPSILPPVRTATQAGGSGFGAGLNPLIDLGEDLRRGDPVTALIYTTDAPGLYLRLATLDEFNGITWQPGVVSTDLDNDVTQFPLPPGLAADVPRDLYTAEVEIRDVSGHWLPVPYPAVSVEGLEGSWMYESDGLAVRSLTSDARGQTYDVTFLGIEPDLGQLTADAEPVVSEQYLDLPELPPIIAETAQAVAGTGTTYERALALQSYFADGDFTYSIDAPVEEGYDGTGVQVVAEFLEKKTGYCVHFASAMAIMARAVGIPARIGVGFQPGVFNPTADDRNYTVTSDDLHAWPELYFEGIGWLRFEPTPGRGSLPDYSFPDAVDDPATPQNEADDPAAAPTVAPTAGAEDPVNAPVDGDQVVGGTGGVNPLLGIIPLLVLALLLLPAGARVGIRMRRMRRVRDGDAEAAWAEIRDTAYDHDWAAPESETPRQLSERLAMVVGSESVAPLQSGVESAAYDRPGSPVMTVEDVDAVRHAIAAAAAARVRLRAVLLPPSLLARFGFTTGPSRG